MSDIACVREYNNKFAVKYSNLFVTLGLLQEIHLKAVSRINSDRVVSTNYLFVQDINIVNNE